MELERKSKRSQEQRHGVCSMVCWVLRIRLGGKVEQGDKEAKDAVSDAVELELQPLNNGSK